LSSEFAQRNISSQLFDFRASDSWAIFSELKVRSYFRCFLLFPYERLAAAFLTQPRIRGDYEMALEPEVGFTLSGEALRLCSFYHVQPPIKLRVNQGSLPIGERALDKSDAVCALLRTAR
jgi:hypothetical protein